MYKIVIKTVGKVYEAIDIFFGRLLRSRKSRRYDLSPPIHCLLDRPAADFPRQCHNSCPRVIPSYCCNRSYLR